MLAAAHLLQGELAEGNLCRYVNQDEPELRGHSVTVKAGAEQIQEMRESAAKTFRPEMVKLLQVGIAVIPYQPAPEASLLGTFHLMLRVVAILF